VNNIVGKNDKAGKNDKVGNNDKAGVACSNGLIWWKYFEFVER
jgi:hypothetical protein